MQDKLREILDEVGSALAAVDPQQMAAFADALAGADEIFLAGQGRSGLVAAAFATRLVHLGKRAHLVGAPTASAAGPVSLLVACSGSGHTRATVAHTQRARAAGSAAWAITADPSSPLATAADHVVAIPMPPSIQPGNSAFEQALLILLDAVVLRLMAKLGQTPQAMLARHANLE